MSQAQRYEPGRPYATVCNPTCTPTNGACNDDCTITCAAGFANCNNNLNDGCETPLNTTSNCGACGTDCSCFENAVCTAGQCRGVQRREGSACNPLPPCTMGMCQASGACACMDRQDLATAEPQQLPDMAHGSDKPGSCDVGGGGAVTAWVLMAAGLASLLLRRRRGSKRSL